MLRLALDALSCVPLSFDVALVSVGVVNTPLILSLTQILNGAKHIGLHSLSILNGFLNDHSFWVALMGTLGHNSFLGSVEEFLLAVTEGVMKGLAISGADAWIIDPFVVSALLLTWRIVAVCFNIHALDFILFFERSTCRVEELLCVERVLGGLAEGMGTGLGLFRPVVSTFITVTEGLTNS